MKRSTYTLLAVATAFSISTMAGSVLGGVLELDPADEPLVISDGISSINKVKIMRTPDGTLFAVYGKAQDVNLEGNTLAWEAKGNYLRKPYDIVIKYSTDKGENWSEPLNIDNTASLSSSKAVLEPYGHPPLDAYGAPDLGIHPAAVNYPGDSDKPNVRNIGNHIVVTWNGKYCPGDEQRFVVYPELEGLAIPYSCQYVSRLVWDSTEKKFLAFEGWDDQLYKTDRLSSGLRDAKQDANRGNKWGHVINWQEDPLGLKLGEAEGPGEGGSGANVNNGTDVWYTYLDLLNAAGTGVDRNKFVNDEYAEAARITRNVFMRRELAGRDYANHPIGEYDIGRTGSSRPNLGQVDDMVIIAYEETKGTQGWDEGKYIRYHAFHFDQPPVGGEHGCVISDPNENSRRVRFITQSAEENDVPVVFIYKQGNYTQGGASDIMFRRGNGGFMPGHLDPPVDVANCRASIMDVGNPIHPIQAIDLTAHGPAMNFSGRQSIDGDDLPSTGQMGEAIDTDDNPIENALAHRGLMRGDLVVIGFSYTPDIERFLALNDQAPYNFYIRRSEDGGATWSDAINVTPQVTADTGVSVREPRMVPTQASGPKCSTDPTDCQDRNVLYVAYGLEENVYTHYQDGADVDIYMLVSLDGGKSFSETVAVTTGDILGGFPDDFEDYETQVVVRPDGRENYFVWSGIGADDVTHTMFRRTRVPGDSVALETQHDGQMMQLSVIPEAESDAEIEDATWNSLAYYEAPPKGYVFPYGVLDYKVSKLRLGGSVDVTLRFEEELAPNIVYWRYGVNPGNSKPKWLKIPTTVEGNTLSFTLTDGATGDLDGERNGTIVDSGAPGIAAKGSGNNKGGNSKGGNN